MERKLRYLEKEIRKDGIPMLEIPGECPEAPQPREMIDLEVRINATLFANLIALNYLLGPNSKGIHDEAKTNSNNSNVNSKTAID